MGNEPSARIRKVQPKLRVVANGSTEVNVLRAEHAAAVRVPDAVAAAVALSRSQSSVPLDPESVPVETERGHLDEPPDAQVSVFLQLTEDLAAGAGGLERIAGETARTANLVTAVMYAEEARELADQPWLAYAELGQPLATPRPAVTNAASHRPSLELRSFGDGRSHHFGQGVLVGLIDVGGFDFAHSDFLDDEGATRFVRIWDQGGDNRPSPMQRGTCDFDYGSELLRSELDGAIAAAPGVGLAAHLLEPQSSMSEGSHGTHVASIAAGNRGVCRNAWIAGVVISIPRDDAERRRSFYDSTRLAHAVDYLLALAKQLQSEHGLDDPPPVSINISLGTNGHAHDDSSPISRWIDACLTQPGRSVCVAAGNAGQDRAASEGDLGWTMGRVHTAGQIPARGLMADIEWNVVGNGIADLSENELELWYGPQDRFAVQVKPPGEPWTDPVEPGQFIENRQLSDRTYLSIYNELYHPANGSNYIAVYLSPQLREEALVGVRAGEWLVRLIGREVRDGSYHGWIERDDPRRAGRVGRPDAWVFPSFFSQRSCADRSTVSSLACGQRIVSVANLDEPARRISVTSSQGPTRDGRSKPDIAAPGTAIVAASGFAGPDDWRAMSGTSMASPHVAGVIGLMLATNPRLTGAQIVGILKRTARPLPGSDFSWHDDAGSGVIDPELCIAEADAMLERKDVT
ncbi:MAG: hypothetical protein QOC64_2624 [Solirubrobacteraceae bacterium]|nr:hypothetical protein [Solirubrobacteraceae bacterium]